jgi:hypothetical protein
VWVVLEGPDCGVSINLDLVWVDILLFYHASVGVHVDMYSVDPSRT